MAGFALGQVVHLRNGILDLEQIGRIPPGNELADQPTRSLELERVMELRPIAAQQSSMALHPEGVRCLVPFHLGDDLQDVLGLDAHNAAGARVAAALPLERGARLYGRETADALDIGEPERLLARVRQDRPDGTNRRVNVCRVFKFCHRLFPSHR